MFWIGAVGAALNCIVSEFTGRAGVVDGVDLFVVHAKREASIQTLVQEGKVEEGSLIAELRPPSMEGTLAVLDSQIKEAQARIGALQVRALPIDQVLGQKQAQLRARIDQQNNFYHDLLKASREFERDYLAFLTSSEKDKGPLETELLSARGNLETLKQQLSVSKTQYDRSVELKGRGLLSNVATVEDREQARLALLAEQGRNVTAIEESERRLAILNARHKAGAAAFKKQLSAIDEEIERTRKTVHQLTGEITEIEQLILDDRTRAKQYTGLEIEAANYQLGALIAEKQKNLSVSQIKAPFAGQVVYRHPSPGLAGDNTPVLAISSGTGFNARIWMSDADVRQIAHAGEVQFGIQNAIMKRYFVGQFKKAEYAPYENRMIAHFDATLPIEAISSLSSSSEPMRVQLLWRPPRMGDIWFRFAILLLLLGALLLCASSIHSRHQRSKYGFGFRESTVDTARQ